MWACSIRQEELATPSPLLPPMYTSRPEKTQGHTPIPAAISVAPRYAQHGAGPRTRPLEVLQPQLRQHRPLDRGQHSYRVSNPQGLKVLVFVDSSRGASARRLVGELRVTGQAARVIVRTSSALEDLRCVAKYLVVEPAAVVVTDAAGAIRARFTRLLTTQELLRVTARLGEPCLSTLEG